jgi:hypothetical protein
MADPQKPEEQTLTKSPHRESIRALPVIGQFTALAGLSQYEDNHGHTLSANTLHCAEEAAPRALTDYDATQLHQKVKEATTMASVAASLGIDPREAVEMTEETAKNDPRITAKMETQGRRLLVDIVAKVAGDMVSGQHDLGTLESPLHTACTTGKNRER